MRKIVLPLFAFIFSFSVNGQNADRCGSLQLIKQQMTIDPAYAKKVHDAEKNKSDRSRSDKGKPTVITIPVAVHVLYYTAAQNISDAQVQSQIDVLNEDFTATNSDYNNFDAGYLSVKGDLEIKFCLIQVIHKQTQHKSFAVNDNMKYSKKGGDDAIDPMHVFNIWVCDIGQNVLGFAYYPGISPEKFGVVCHTNAFGKGAQYSLFAAYNLGRTTTHEAGHCLGLVHIWGDSHCGDDFVGDTPLHNDPNFGCPGPGHLSTCTGTPPEMWMNYMDYTDDKCMYFFSDGQVARADYFITNDPQLNSIVNSACNLITTTSGFTNGSNTAINASRINGSNRFSIYPAITSDEITLMTSNTVKEKAELSIYNQTGSLVMKQQLFIAEGNNSQTINVSKLGNGIYILRLSSGAEKKTEKFIIQH
jgi:predicted Zn-dependent protease